jgi:hypothetical protein
MPDLLVFAEENAQQDSVARDLHGHTHFKALKWSAATWPSQTARRHGYDRSYNVGACVEPFPVVQQVECLEAER